MFTLHSAAVIEHATTGMEKGFSSASASLFGCSGPLGLVLAMTDTARMKLQQTPSSKGLHPLGGRKETEAGGGGAARLSPQVNV